MTLRPIVLLLFAMLSLSACQSATQKLGNPELPYPPVKQPQVGDILHLPTGIYVDQQVMLDQAVRTQVVLSAKPMTIQLRTDFRSTYSKPCSKTTPVGYLWQWKCSALLNNLCSIVGLPVN